MLAASESVTQMRFGTVNCHGIQAPRQDVPTLLGAVECGSNDILMESIGHGSLVYTSSGSESVHYLYRSEPPKSLAQIYQN